VGQQATAHPASNATHKTTWKRLKLTAFFHILDVFVVTSAQCCLQSHLLQGSCPLESIRYFLQCSEEVKITPSALPPNRNQTPNNKCFVELSGLLNGNSGLVYFCSAHSK
jgi:hypothetical protein